VKVLAVFGFAAFLVFVGRNPDAYIGAGIWLACFAPFIVKEIGRVFR
jgi:hypothetical protein